MKNLFRWGAVFLLPVLALLLITPDTHAAAIGVGSFGVCLSTIGATLPTLVDILKRQNPDGSPAKVGELLSQTNHIIEDLGWKEGNKMDGHQITQRTQLPTVYYRLLNQGVAPSKSTTAQVTEQTAILEARGQVDVNIAKLNGNSAAWRLSENKPFIEAMGQKFVEKFFYGNFGLDPEQFTGLSTRYSSLSAGNAQNIIDGGGTGSDNMSIWFIPTNSEEFFGIYPKGSNAGLQHEDLGIDDAFDASGNRFRAYLDWYQWQHGIALVDWRYVVRICNIDVSNMVAQSSQAVMTTLMIKAVARLKSLNGVRIYMNRTALQYLEIEQRAAVITGGGLTYSNVNGQPVTSFRGLPIRIVDQLLETEARVT